MGVCLDSYIDGKNILTKKHMNLNLKASVPKYN